MQNVIKLVVLFLISGATLYAQENKISTSVALVLMNMDYREYNSSGQILDSEKSSLTNLIGIDMGLKFLMYSNARSKTTLEVNAMILGGYTDYVGSKRPTDLDPIPKPYGSYLSTTANTIVDFELGIKRKHLLNDGFNYYYAFKIGYRYWERGLSQAQIEDYEWYSLRTMMGTNYKLNQKFQLGVELEYQYGFKETMSASDLSSTFDLGGADIFKLSFPLVYKYNNNIDFNVEYIYTEQTIKESNVINGYYEPRSTAKNQYLQIGLDFKF